MLSAVSPCLRTHGQIQLVSTQITELIGKWEMERSKGGGGGGGKGEVVFWMVISNVDSFFSAPLFFYCCCCSYPSQHKYPAWLLLFIILFFFICVIIWVDSDDAWSPILNEFELATISIKHPFSHFPSIQHIFMPYQTHTQTRISCECFFFVHPNLSKLSWSK